MSESKGVPAPLVPSRIKYWSGGVLYEFEATDERLLDSGLVTPDQLPGPSPRCYTKPMQYWGVRKCSRLANGLARLTICALAVTATDRPFKRWLGETLADTGFSLVKGEGNV